MTVAALVVGTVAVQANAETVTFKSGSYADFRQIFSREAATATVTIAATLAFPDQARDRYPAVVVVHTIAGYLEANEGWHAVEFRKAGFVTLTNDSPAARSMRQTSSVGSSGGPPWGSAVAEAYAALRLLASDPRIDASRIAIVGFSFGGEVAHLAAFERLRAALVPDQTRFAAHVAYYPAGVYGAVAEQGAYTGASILLLLGEKDDNLPIAKARHVRNSLQHPKDSGQGLSYAVRCFDEAGNLPVFILGHPQFGLESARDVGTSLAFLGGKTPQ